MLQIKIYPNDKYSMAEMTQMALEGGAQWLVIAPTEYDDFRETGVEIAGMCREVGVILTIEGTPDHARELGLHGVLVPFGQAAPAVREALGPEAIVGTEVSSVESALAMERADIDYLLLPAAIDEERVAALIGEARDAGCSVPFVAYVDNPCATDYKMLLSLGFSGFYVVKGFFEADDPVEKISEVLKSMQK